MLLGLPKQKKTCSKRPCKPLLPKPCNKTLHHTRLPWAPWGAYTLSHRDKLWGVNIIKVSALCGKLPIDIIKGFPRNITKHTERNMLRHSTNPCGKPSAFSPFPSCPLEGAYTLTHLIKPWWGEYNPFRFPRKPSSTVEVTGQVPAQNK